MPNEAVIRTAGDGESAQMEPGSMLIAHHRAGVAELKVERLSGGHLLHLALAGCVFNNVLRLARDKGIAVEEATVRVGGDFTDDGDSTGIECEVKVFGDASPEELQALAREAFDDSTVASVLRRGARVDLTGV
jgi:uncharacterized OsmC-like protein